MDVHFQHISYFPVASLAASLAAVGFAVLETRSILDGHDFGFLCRAVEPAASFPAVAAGASDAGRLAERRGRLAELLRARRDEVGAGFRLALYGATAQGCAAASELSGLVDVVVDDSAVSHGWHVFDGTRDVVIEPSDRLSRGDVTDVLIGAYIHAEPIGRKLAGLGLPIRVWNLDPRKF